MKVYNLLIFKFYNILKKLETRAKTERNIYTLPTEILFLNQYFLDSISIANKHYGILVRAVGSKRL